MNSKRPNDQNQASGPPAKKALVQFEPVKIGPVYSLEDMDIKVLQFQNKKLVERIEQRRKAEDELKRRIEQLEQRQATDDAVLCIVNRYWNQLDEDVRVLLQRFDAEGADEVEKQNESAAVTSFLTLLSQWDKQEIEHKLNQRVEFSKRAIGKLLQAYDRLLQRKEKLWNSIKNKNNEASVKVEEELKEGDQNIKQEEDRVEDKESGESEKMKEKTSDTALDVVPEAKVSLSDAIIEEMDRLVEENKKLQNLITETHEEHYKITTNNFDLQDKLAAAETELAELKNVMEELEYKCETAHNRSIKMDKYLNEVVSKLKTYQEGEIKVQGGGEGVSKNKFNEISVEMEEQRELATTRLGELEKLQEEHEQVLKEVEKLKMDLSMLPESVVIETTEYKCLQSQFSVLYNEATQIKNQLDECKNLLDVSSASHLKQVQQMEADELSMQKKLRTEMIEMEDGHAQVRREYDLLRSEFELTLTANEQTGPINREMRNLITSLKNHNEQLKGEIQRYKRKLKEAHTEIHKLRQDNSSSTKQPAQEQETLCVPDTVREQEENERNKQELETIKELKNEIKKLQEKERETKLHWESLKNMSKDGRDKSHQVAASEKKARLELEELKNQIRKLQQELDKKERKKYSDDEINKKVKKHEETIADLQKSLAAQKQEEEAMLNEMEVTGQAFEDMQEQNVRLLQQLREKDDANFKLMSERIKSNQIQKLLRDEKDVLNEQVETLQHQLDAQNIVVRKLEEKEHLLMTTINSLDKELTLKQQALELHKRKALESVQSATDLKLHLDKYQAQLKEAQTAVTDKTAALQQQSFKYRRMQEEVATIRKKLDRAKKIEMASSADEVLMEEIREYKEQLTCPSCKVKKKDAVLTKCFHVFCLECLKTRYETRQRKCPKCNATFGANDYHRIYLE